MPVTVRYIVRRRFRYGKRLYRPGEEFVPEGNQFDGAILRSNLVKVDNGLKRQKLGPNGRALEIKPKRSERLKLAAAAEARAEVRAEKVAKEAKPKPAAKPKPKSLTGE